MSRLVLQEGAAPSTPASGKASLFVDATGRPKLLGDDGVTNELVARQDPNYVRNSGMWFAQRQTPGTLTTYSSATNRLICADGWGVSCENASAQYRRIDTQAGPEAGLQNRYWGEFTKITTLGKLHVCQVLEGVDAESLRGRTVRLQCWMKQVVGATPVVRLGLLQLQAAGTIDAPPAAFLGAWGGTSVDPVLGTNVARIAPKAGVTGDNCTLNGNAYDCTLSASWQRFGGVFTVPSDTKNLIPAVWGNAQFAATNGFGLSQVVLTDGEEIQDWAPLALPLEMRRVRRFYQKTFALETGPVQNAGVTTGCLRSRLGKAAAVVLAAQFQWRYDMELRAAATTLTTYNPAAANVQVRQIGGTAADLTATATANSTAQSVDITATGVATGTVGDQVGVHVTADAEI